MPASYWARKRYPRTMLGGQGGLNLYADYSIFPNVNNYIAQSYASLHQHASDDKHHYIPS